MKCYHRYRLYSILSNGSLIEKTRDSHDRGIGGGDRLPVKSLLRLKATCKRWHILIKSPSFIDLHRHRHRLDYHDHLVLSWETPDGDLMFYSCAISAHNPAITTTTPLFNLRWFPRLAEFAKWPFLPSHRDDDDDEYYPFIPKPYTVLFGPLNNGIYLHTQCDSQRPRLVSVATSKFALCNLATREYKFLNPFPSDMGALLSDLVRNPCQLGYGFGCVHDEAGFIVDYKGVLILICWARGQHFSRMLSFIYSLRRGSWDNIADVRRGMAYSATDKKAAAALARLVNREGRLDTPRSLMNLGATVQQQAFLNGSWHWLDVHSLGIKSRFYDRVFVFDVANERFQYFEGPPHDYESLGDSRSPYEIRRGLFLLNAHLAVIYLPHDLGLRNRYRCLGFDVWMMMDYGIGDSWVKIFSANTAFNNVSAYFLGLRYSTCSSSNSSSSIRIERVFIHDGYSEQLMSWDGSRVTEHGFCLQLRKEQVWNAIGISTYVETLDSLMLAP